MGESIKQLSQKARGVLARNYKFFTSSDISFKLKLQVAKSIVLSITSYGQEIISLTKSQRKKFDVVLNMTLRRVFVQSYSTKSAALRLIAGQQTIESTRVLSRIVNFLRIKNLPNDRALKTLVNAKEWTASTYTSGKHVTDMIFLRRAFKFSSVSHKTFSESISNYDKIKSKSIFKKILFNYDIIKSQQSIKNTHARSLLQFFTPNENHPLLLKCGKKYETLISWMIASTDTLVDKPFQKRSTKIVVNKSNQKKQKSKQVQPLDLPSWCRLCNNRCSTESREHLLTDCPATIHFISSFSDKINAISPSKYEEFCSLSHENRWLWILGGGSI